MKNLSALCGKYGKYGKSFSCCDPSLEPFGWDSSNEGSHFLISLTKIIFELYLILSEEPQQLSGLSCGLLIKKSQVRAPHEAKSSQP